MRLAMIPFTHYVMRIEPTQRCCRINFMCVCVCVMCANNKSKSFTLSWVWLEKYIVISSRTFTRAHNREKSLKTIISLPGKWELSSRNRLVLWTVSLLNSCGATINVNFRIQTAPKIDVRCHCPVLQCTMKSTFLFPLSSPKKSPPLPLQPPPPAWTTSIAANSYRSLYCANVPHFKWQFAKILHIHMYNGMWICLYALCEANFNWISSTKNIVTKHAHKWKKRLLLKQWFAIVDFQQAKAALFSSTFSILLLLDRHHVTNVFVCKWKMKSCYYEIAHMCVQEKYQVYVNLWPIYEKYNVVFVSYTFRYICVQSNVLVLLPLSLL